MERESEGRHCCVIAQGNSGVTADSANSIPVYNYDKGMSRMLGSRRFSVNCAFFFVNDVRLISAHRIVAVRNATYIKMVAESNDEKLFVSKNVKREFYRILITHF